jgi:hypothetical protein
MRRDMPEWNIPPDLADIVAEEDIWEDESWDPIRLSVLGGTEYEGRAILLAWQVEFEPFGGDFVEAGKHIFGTRQPDAYGWCEAVVERMAKAYPGFADRLHTGDTESSTCVIWVESEEACKALIEVVWELIYG